VLAGTTTWPAAVAGRPATEQELGRLAAHLTQREIHVLAALCQPVPSGQAAATAPTVRQRPAIGSCGCRGRSAGTVRAEAVLPVSGRRRSAGGVDSPDG
jgi:hypothetical protein